MPDAPDSVKPPSPEPAPVVEPAVDPVEEALPQDPEKLKTLLDEKQAARAALVVTRDEAQMEINQIDLDIVDIKNEVSYIYDIQKRPEQARDPKTGAAIQAK